MVLAYPCLYAKESTSAVDRARGADSPGTDEGCAPGFRSGIRLVFAASGEIAGYHRENGTNPVQAGVADPGNSQAARVRGRYMCAEQGVRGHIGVSGFRQGRRRHVCMWA
jgi:hypothetical protein